jgi:hypothetical protein
VEIRRNLWSLRRVLAPGAVHFLMASARHAAESNAEENKD